MFSVNVYYTNMDAHCIRLLVDRDTCISRAKADTLRPVSSRPSWQGVVDHWFAAWEPVDAVQEGFASYQEIENG